MTVAAWCAKDKHPNKEKPRNWLQVDLGRVCLVGAVATQGRHDEKYANVRRYPSHIHRERVVDTHISLYPSLFSGSGGVDD